MVFGVLNYIKSAFIIRGFPGGSDGKEFACNAGDLGLIPGLGRSPGEGNGYPLNKSIRKLKQKPYPRSGLKPTSCPRQLDQ